MLQWNREVFLHDILQWSKKLSTCSSCIILSLIAWPRLVNGYDISLLNISIQKKGMLFHWCICKFRMEPDHFRKTVVHAYRMGRGPHLNLKWIWMDGFQTMIFSHEKQLLWIYQLTNFIFSQDISHLRSVDIASQWLISAWAMKQRVRGHCSASVRVGVVTAKELNKSEQETDGNIFLK